ncbi:DUF6584 family protein [Streptomyces sp. NPDC060194]|uniref:DUF6584 family protein n=1 Tax=Streptomyces sp. NPDC060194 TaxID=3347069 RepID=UPI00365FC0AE
MPITETLGRVDADLAAGRVPVARQRLRGLVGSYPRDLELSGVYRAYGEPAEAGRWSYLAEDRDPDETRAFEERYATPLERMAALAWRGPAAEAGTAFAREQLAGVAEAAARQLGRGVDWATVREALRDWRDDGAPSPEESRDDGVLARVGCALAALVALLAAGVWVVGLVVVVRRLL